MPDPCPQHGWLDADDCPKCKVLRQQTGIKPEEDHRDKPYAQAGKTVVITAEQAEEYNALRLKDNVRPKSSK